ncbi:hypothetical protein QRN89_20155 [Streptomyces chengbuensis]|uniref:hypothetical protein n=1 Tax=Streptomyces TaxID=1883 RepID=UPI0025B45652|nr:hypothetical protein [Streptomyces sp. HUAS CB01]WJY51903.1 hypothetical protein QRN89_20155 [Streptomyces sp. HUAS CB01]
MTRRNRRQRPVRLSGIFSADVQVFRFYPDGTVLDVLVRPAPRPENAATIATWLRRELPTPGVHTARYEQHGERVAFTRGHLRDEEIEVRGTWSEGRLALGLAGRGRGLAPRRFARLDAARR